MSSAQVLSDTQRAAIMLEVRITTENKVWNAFVAGCPEATVFHSFNWAAALAKGAGHQPYFLSAMDDGEIVGVLPLCLMQSRLFGRFLVSLPHYLGGICSSRPEATSALLEAACELARKLSVDTLELRGNSALPEAENKGFVLDRHKASYLVDLTPGEAQLWQSLRKQTRNRIRKGQQSGCKFESGHHLLEEFWQIFSANMREIGSPTFAPGFFSSVFDAFGEDAEILLARQGINAVAAKLVLRFRDTLTLLWGAALPQAKSEGANFFLTWEALRYALARGCHVLDQGRSTVGSGPYHFKAHWGGRELVHHWYIYRVSGAVPDMRAESPRFALARKIWQKLPLSATRVLGPWISRQIP
jgi:FemAB-related protein (PEP-CTERM system-associated)